MIRLKRNCNGCRASGELEIGNNTCGLGYKTAVKTELWGRPVQWKPLEECPKPKTYNDYFNAERKHHS